MTTERLKEMIGRILYAGSLGLLAVYGLVLAVSFAVAASDGRIPNRWWVRDGENHGPWRHYEPVHTLFKIALASLLSGALMAGHTPAFMKGNRPVVVLAIAIVVAIVHMVFLNWLNA